MAECRECDRSIPEGSNFCSHCGAPQNEKAAEALESFTKRQAKQLPEAELAELFEEGEQPPSASLDRRVSYAVGWVTLVGALAMVPSLASVFLLVAGIIILPPLRRLFAKQVGQRLDKRAVVGFYIVAVAVGSALFWLV